jgi:hypothetical protein
VHFLRCVLAEWQLVRARLVRSRLGIWLLLLGASAVALAARTETFDLVGLGLRVGMPGAALGVAFAAGSDTDRAALALTLTHPTTPLAVALGRWLAAVTAAVGVMLAALVAVGGLRDESAIELVRVATAGAAAAAAVAAAALPGVWLGGNAVAGVLFLYIAVVSGLPPEAMREVVSPGVLRQLGIAALQFAPGVWRYRALAAGDVVAWLHATAWVAAGVPLAALLLATRRR